MAITNYNSTTIKSQTTDPTTTEGDFRLGLNEVIDAVDAINTSASTAINVTETNSVTPVVSSFNAANNEVTLTSNIVVGTADPPVNGTDFSAGQIYFTVE